MKRVVLTCLVTLALASCGADGEPVKPAYSAKTSIGYNTKTGAFNSTSLGVCFGPSCG